MRTGKKTPHAVSIKDIARLADVSISTVSRVINKHASVKERHRLRVLEAIKETGFQPSVFAQRLATGKSNCIALVIPRYEGLFYSFYALELIRGIGTVAAALKLDLLLHLTDDRSGINLKGIGGIIFADIIANRPQLEEALKQNVPAVVINNYVEDLDVSCIAVDNVSGAKQAVEYLIGLGHSRIAHITGDLVSQAAAHRLEGYRQAMGTHGFAVPDGYVITTDYSRGQARQACDRLIELKERPTAVFVASDSMALEVIAAARDKGVSVPRDLSVVGYDDNPSGLYGPVALTTVRQPLVRMAEDSVRELNSIMRSSAPVRVKKQFLPVQLIVRESCRSIG